MAINLCSEDISFRLGEKKISQDLTTNSNDYTNMILNMLADRLFSLLSLFYSERQQYNKILQNIKPGGAGGGGRGARGFSLI